MDRSGLFAVLVAAAVVLTGCTAVETDTQITVSPAPIPESTTPPSGDFAPGVTTDGIRWSAALIRAHSHTLKQTSFTVKSIRTVESTNPEYRLRTMMAGTFSPNKSRYHQTFIERDRDGDQRRSELYADGERLFEALGPIGERRYYMPRTELYSPPRPESFIGNPMQDDRIFIGIKAFETRVESVNQSDGEPRYRIVGTEVRLPELLSIGTIGTYADHIKDPSLAVTVGQSGVVYDYRLQFTAVKGNQTLAVNHTIQYTDVGSTSVVAPNWYPFAREEHLGSGNATSL